MALTITAAMGRAMAVQVEREKSSRRPALLPAPASGQGTDTAAYITRLRRQIAQLEHELEQLNATVRGTLEAAALKGCSSSTISRNIRAGRINARWDARYSIWIIDRASLELWEPKRK